jgi:hypothetical protein
MTRPQVDQSATSIRCTIWGKEAESFEAEGGVAGAVIVIKAAKLSDYSGMKLPYWQMKW